MYIITIDTGTTNTRIKVWKDKTVIASSSMEVGVRDTAITGSIKKLCNGIRVSIEKAIHIAYITTKDIQLIIASGMITSNVGLHEVPHIQAPVGLEKLSKGMVKVTIHEVIDIPIWFIPGIKNKVEEIEVENCELMDMMRGEEVETFGILEKQCLKGPALVILPGSHTKFVRIDENNKITGCTTTLAGELLSVITRDTILSNALEGSFIKEINEELILKGAQYSQEVGLNRSCFLVRVIDQFTKHSSNDKANFLGGMIFGNDLQAIKNSISLKMEQDLPIIIGGGSTLKRIFEVLIKNDNYFSGEIKVVNDDIMKDIAGIGALTIARTKGLIKK